MSRIDAITIELDVADEFEGRRTIRIPVSVDDAEFKAAVEKRWQAYSDELMKLAGKSTDIGFL